MAWQCCLGSIRITGKASCDYRHSNVSENNRSPVTGHRSASGHRRNPRLIAKWRTKRHNGAMPSVQIKDVPEHTHAVLRQRAATAHQSLQEYLRTKLIQEASAPTVEEVLDRAGGRAGGRVPIRTASEILREDRDRR